MAGPDIFEWPNILFHLYGPRTYHWPMPAHALPGYPRFLRERLTAALSDTPVVLLHGPRQCGKTTLARQVCEPLGYGYLSFDDDTLRAAAVADPAGLVADLPARMVLDEVQRVPEIFTALKAAVDSDRAPGRFLLTGSANVLLLPRLADSLAGRIEPLRLHPLAQCELAGRDSGFLQALFESSFGVRRHARMAERLAECVSAGGYPAALARPAPRRRDWYRAYVEALVQRDVQDLRRIGALDTLPRLLAAAAAQTARLANIADLAGPFHVSRPTIRDYVTLLERVFLLEQLPPWHRNQLSRLVKTPKLHLCDTGLAAALLRVDAAGLWRDRALLGRLLETFVMQELRRMASWHDEPIAFHHFRDKDGVEVDLVLERGADEVAGVEVKAAASVTEADFRGLRKLQAAAGSAFRCGVVLYDGEHTLPFGPGLYAVPIRALWETSAVKERQ